MSEVKRLREWTITGSRLNEIKMFGDTVLHFNELVKVREVSEAEDAAVEAMRKALGMIDAMEALQLPPGFLAKHNVMAGFAREALEVYDRALRGEG